MTTISSLPQTPMQTAARVASGAPAATSAPADSVALSSRPAAQLVGSVSPQEKMTVSVILKPNRELAVPTSPFAAPDRGQLDAVASTPKQVANVASFADTSGLKVVASNPETHTVQLEGTAADFSKAFGVEFGRYKTEAGQEYRGYTGKVQLPEGLAGNVDAVLGLDNRPIASPRMQVSPEATKGGGFTGKSIGKLYNFPTGLDGTGQTIGIIELGGGFKNDDLAQYFHNTGIKQPQVTAVSVDGATNKPEGSANSADGEVDLDIEVAGSVAPGAKQAVYFAPNTEQGFVDAILAAVHDKTNHPNVISISWGAPEKEWTKEGMQAMNNAFKEAAAAGINVYAAAGDNGAKDGEKDGKLHADFPAAAPYAIGCGGTKLEDANGHIASETVWRDMWGFGGATGGGVSDVFAKPDFQGSVNVPKPTVAGGGRGVPDVAGNASPTTGYLVVADGQEMSIGGTSAVSPLYAGLTAVLAQGVGHNLGWLTPTLYKHPEAFNDIVKGGNGGYDAAKGWDATTGLGSPNGSKLLDVLKAAQAEEQAGSAQA
jgi:kumamolisin